MAETNPTHGTRAVPLDLPPSQVAILRKTLADCLAGVREDLAGSPSSRNPDQARREADAYQRLLAGIARGKLLLPDDAALAAVEKIAEVDDRANNYAEVVANHDALYGLVSLLKGARK